MNRILGFVCLISVLFLTSIGVRATELEDKRAVAKSNFENGYYSKAAEMAEAVLKLSHRGGLLQRVWAFCPRSARSAGCLTA